MKRYPKGFDYGLGEGVIRNKVHICPKCKGYRSDPFSLDGKKVFDPKWKTVVKGEKWQCRNCGTIV